MAGPVAGGVIGGIIFVLVIVIIIVVLYLVLRQRGESPYIISKYVRTVLMESMSSCEMHLGVGLSCADKHLMFCYFMLYVLFLRSFFF